MSNLDSSFEDYTDRESRRIERERRLAEIEESYKKVLRETQEKHDKLFDVVFREEGDVLDSQVEKEMNQFAEMDKIKKKKEKSILNRITKSLSPQKSDRDEPTFPQVAPVNSPSVGASLPQLPSARFFSMHDQNPGSNNINLPDAYRDSEEGYGNRQRSFMVTKSVASRPITYVIVGTVFAVSLIIGLAVTAKDMKEAMQLSPSQRTIRDLLQDLHVNVKEIENESSPQYNALTFLATELDEQKLSLETPLRNGREERDGEGNIQDMNQAYKDHRYILERYTLAVLFESTGEFSSGWSKDDKWLDRGVSVCDGWHGVTCTTVPTDASEGAITVGIVTGINLSENNLKGTIPAELSHLEDLETLHLEGNRLSGKVPDSLGDLSSLRSLQIGENYLSGNVPKSVCELTENGSKISASCGGGLGSLECSCCEECS